MVAIVAYSLDDRIVSNQSGALPTGNSSCVPNMDRTIAGVLSGDMTVADLDGLGPIAAKLRQGFASRLTASRSPHRSQAELRCCPLLELSTNGDASSTLTVPLRFDAAHLS